jgi:hypothetical protein
MPHVMTGERRPWSDRKNQRFYTNANCRDVTDRCHIETLERALVAGGDASLNKPPHASANLKNCSRSGEREKTSGV